MADVPAAKLDGATRSLLLEQFAVEQFLLGLALVDRFLFDVVVVPTPRVARAVLALLREEIPERRGEPLRVRVLAPDPEKASALDPVESATLIDDVLVPLLRKEPAAAPGLTLTWVDASDARTIDDPAWAEFFSRLNERRNAAVDAQPGPLVLVVPPRMERAFAHAAPDVWSVRSGVYRVRVSDLETHVLEVDPERHPPIVGPRTARDAPRYLTVSMALQGEEPARFDDAQRAWMFSESASQLLERGALDEAEATVRRAVESARHAVEASPQSKDALSSLERVLARAGSIAESLGDSAWTRAIAQERLAVVEGLVGSSPPSAELLARRAWAKRDLAQHSGVERLPTIRAAVVDARELVTLDPDSTYAAHTLAACLAVLGEQELKSGDLDLALAALDESIELLGRTDDVWGGSSRVIYSTTIVARAIRAKARVRSGRYDEALADARAAVDLAKVVRQRLARQPEASRLLTITHYQLAKTYRALGDLARAAGSLDAASAVTREMIRAWPRSQTAALWRALVLQEAAEIASERGRLEEARTWVDEAATFARALQGRVPDETRDELGAILALQRRLESSVAPNDAAADPDPGA